MNIEKENRAFFAGYDPDLLTELENNPEVVVEPARKQGLTLRVGKHYVHGKYHPARDAATILAQTKDPAGLLHLHFGFGLGYLLQADQTKPGGHILIFEPDPGLMHAALCHVPLAHLFSEKAAFLTCSRRRLGELMRRFLTEKQTFRILINPYHRDRHLAELRLFVETIKRERNRKEMMESAGSRAFFRLFLESTFKSLPFTTGLPGVEHLRNGFRDKPAVVVAAGPSLDKNLAELAAYQGQVLIFSVSRAARALERFAIRPDFLVHNEAQDYRFLVEKCQNLQHTTFLLSEQCHHLFFELPAARQFVYQNPANSINRWLIAHDPKFQRQFIATAGSVATDAAYLALVMGCNPIILLGQDLALKGDRYYASSPDNKAFKHGIGDLRDTPGFFGGKVRTLANYLHFLSWYEDSAEVWRQQRPGLTLINASEGGARLTGFRQMKLRQVASLFFRQSLEIQATLNKAALVGTRQAPSLNRLHILLEKTLKQLDRSEVHAEAFEQCFAKFNQSRGEDPPNLQRIQVVLGQLEDLQKALLVLHQELPMLALLGDKPLQTPTGEAKDLVALTADLKLMAQNWLLTRQAMARLKRCLISLQKAIGAAG